MSTRKKFTQEQRDAIVKRYLTGDSVVQLSIEFGVSQPAIYVWVRKYKADMIKSARRQNMLQPDIEKAEKRDLAIENVALKQENLMLRQKLFDICIETGRI